MHRSGYLTFTRVEALYEHGDSGALIEVVLREDEPAAVRGDARRALRLLARLGDRDAGVFCGPLSGTPGARCDAA